MTPTMLLILLALLPLALVIRLISILPRGRGKPSPHFPEPAKASLAIFMGSGGHTAEMRTLLSSINYERYSPRIYVYCTGDDMSLRAVSELESRGASASNMNYSLLSLPRARAVGEGRLSTLVSASRTLAVAILHVFLLPLLKRPIQPWADVLVLNGPGTSVVLVAAVYIRRILGLRYTRIMYVESFARVKSLSLSGRLLRYFVDVFVVQWPEAATGEGVTYRGWLV